MRPRGAPEQLEQRRRRAVQLLQAGRPMSAVARQGICVYCGQCSAETSDHVPPKNLFSKPRPSSLVTVPSCLGCNEGASQDDEYFRLVVTLRHDIDHPDAAVARDSAMRSLGRPQASGLRTAFLSAIREIDLRSPGGLYIGRTGMYDIDVGRLDRVARRITLGLFYKETGRPLPDNYAVKAYLLSAVDPSATDALARLSHVIDALKSGRSPAFVGRRVMSYWWRLTQEDHNVSAWLLVFYERVSWITITAPRRLNVETGRHVSRSSRAEC
jgi:hypothetical protein